MVAFILVLIYVISAIMMYHHTRIAHSSGGRWYNLDTTFGDFLIVFIPVFNTFAALVAWISFYPVKGKGINFNGFFVRKK